MLELNPLHHPVCLLRPDRLTRFSAWHEHIPFAMLLVDILRPALIVELGTQYGDSYCAFCQAVQHLDIDARCYAIDTWQGDEQTGFYGEDVLDSLRRHHDPKYGSFSRLIQSTFDDALPHFMDGTIDLLHIDGYHTYDAVKHDFESWLPKLSASGIVLFHDTNVHERDFGVWRYWQEVSGKYASYEFLHGHGLGMLAPGNVHATMLQEMFHADGEDTARIREYFFQLGHKWTIYNDLQSKTTNLAHTQELLNQCRNDLSRTQSVLNQKNIDFSRLQELLNQRNIDFAKAKEALNHLNAELSNTHEILNQRNAHLAIYEETLRTKDEQYTKVHEVLNQQEGRLKHLQEVLGKREERLGELQETLRVTDERLVRSQTKCEQQGEQVTTVQKALYEREQRLTQTEEVLRQRDEQIATFQHDARRASHIAHLEEKLHSIYHSRGWRVLSLGYRLKDGLKALVYGKGTYWLRSLGSQAGAFTRTETPLVFTCNICGTHNTKPLASFGRESPNCDRCRSTVRMRSIIHVLSVELFGRCLALPDFPIDKSVKGIGMSDWSGYADPLVAKLDYQNTFYHCEPR
ncbi:hypothetical protein C2W62_34390, partial [Candidatus Entotheonella serta]